MTILMIKTQTQLSFTCNYLKFIKLVWRKYWKFFIWDVYFHMKTASYATSPYLHSGLKMRKYFEVLKIRYKLAFSYQIYKLASLNPKELNYKKKKLQNLQSKPVKTWTNFQSKINDEIRSLSHYRTCLCQELLPNKVN